MPEQITKYPDVTMEVLRSAGAQCGNGVESTILTRCPAERFCALPGGELCIYGIEDIPKMTQIGVDDLGAIVCRPADTAQASFAVDWFTAGVLGVGFVLGYVVRRISIRRH